MWQSIRNFSDPNCKKRLQSPSTTTIRTTITITTTKIRRSIFRCFLIMITVTLMSMSSMMRRNVLFSNAFLSSRMKMRNHHRHTSTISHISKHQPSAISIPISNTRSSSIRISRQQQHHHHHRSFSINNHPHSIKQQQQQSYTQSTTSLAAAATATATATNGRRSKKSFSKNYPLVVHGPPGFVFPLPKKKDMSKQQKRPFKLVIVESPSKCLTISKILQQYVKENDLNYDFVITSSMGHIRNIPKDKTSKDQIIAGIDLDNDYQPSYTIIEGKENLTRELQELSASAQQLVLATDDDREGEAMAWHLLQLLEGDGNDITITTTTKNTKEAPLRVRFTEITRKAIVDAIEHPETSLRDNLVQAQETRRVLDRLAGFTVSPILWKKIVS